MLRLQAQINTDKQTHKHTNTNEQPNLILVKNFTMTSDTSI